MSSKKSRAKKRARQNGGVGGIQSYAINLGGQTSVVERGSKAERDLLSRGGVAGTEADKTNRSSYLKSLNNPSSPNYVKNGDEPMSDAQKIAETITGNSLKQEAPIPITAPKPESPNIYNSTVNGLQPPAPDTTTTTSPTQPTPMGSADSSYLSLLQKKFGLLKDVNTEDIRGDILKETNLRQKEKRVREVSDKIRAVAAQSTANQLAVTGQGRGIPEAVIGGQQAQFAKEAAIQTIPLSAELDIVQGDLESAQTKFDDLFRIRVADETNKVNRWNSLIDETFNFFTDEEKSKLADVKEEKKYQLGLFRDTQENLSKFLVTADPATRKAILAITPPDLSKKGELDRYKQDLARYGVGAISDGGALSAEKQLKVNTGVDGYTDTNKYATLRSTSKLSPTEFDNRFGYLVNPQYRAYLGIGDSGVQNYSKTQLEQTLNQQMGSPSWDSYSDDIKRAYIQSLGLNADDYL